MDFAFECFLRRGIECKKRCGQRNKIKYMNLSIKIFFADFFLCEIGLIFETLDKIIELIYHLLKRILTVCYCINILRKVKKHEKF